MQLESRVTRRARRPAQRSGWTFVLRKLHEHQIYILVGLGLCMIILAGFVLARTTAAGGDEWRTELLHASHQAVRFSVREDLRVAFAGMEETQFEELPGGKYTLTGWVDLISEQGGIIRQGFTCTMFRDDNGEWQTEKITILPR